MLNAWLLKFNDTSEYGEAAKDPIVYDWEAGFIEVVAGEDKPEGQPAETDFYAISPRSYDDEIMATLASNLSILLIDTVLILFYVILVLGRFNAVEQRVRKSWNLLKVLWFWGCFQFQYWIFMAKIQIQIPVQAK